MDKDTQLLQKQAYKKYFSNRLALGLRNFNPESSLKQSYLNTIYCKNTILVENGTMRNTSKYCKNRWCVTCNNIRTGRMINGYEEQLQAFKSAYFVTLTLPTCKAEYLPKRIKEMEAEWRKILKNNTKNKVFSTLKGLRKMECTIRPQEHYHYHYHIIIEGKKQAEWLLKQWLNHFPEANSKAQDIRKADKNSLKELFKYFTKLTVKDDNLFSNGERYVGQFKSLDYIFSSLKGKRVYQPFGGVKVISEELNDYNLELQFTDAQQNLYKWVKNDWVSDLGECLTGYTPTETTLELLKYCPLP
jgi:hypothetical protein